MFKILLRGSVVAIMFMAAGSLASPGRAAWDEGKSLVFAPPPAGKELPSECGRDCLYGLVDNYFNALASRCPCNVALAPTVKYTENGQIVKPGEGIWKTFTRRGTYRVYLADPAAGEVGYYGDFSEDNGLLLGVMALRMRVQDRRVTEIEMIAVREQRRPKGGLGANTAGIMTPRMLDELDPGGFVSPDPVLLQPLPAAETREQLVAATTRYFDGFTQSKGSLVPFGAECSRRENGMPATNNAEGPVVDSAQPAFRIFSQGCAQELDRGFFSALSTVRGVRPLVVDEAQGLVLELTLFDNEGSIKSVSVSGVGNVAVPGEFLRPITFMAPQLFKIENGKIREIEGLSWPVPFGMSSGWEK